MRRYSGNILKDRLTMHKYSPGCDIYATLL